MPQAQPLPKYKCVAIAQDITRLLNLSPALHWTQVRDYANPPLFPRDDVVIHRYESHKRPLIRSALDRELRMQHVRTP